jgi:hypothetical protein
MIGRIKLPSSLRDPKELNWFYHLLCFVDILFEFHLTSAYEPNLFPIRGNKREAIFGRNKLDTAQTRFMHVPTRINKLPMKYMSGSCVIVVMTQREV